MRHLSVSISYSHRIQKAVVGLLGEQGIGLKPASSLGINTIGSETNQNGEVRSPRKHLPMGRTRDVNRCAAYTTPSCQMLFIAPHRDDHGIIGGGLSTEGRSGAQKQD